MDINMLYARTEKGQNALVDKYMNLPHTLKRALIIVDGSRDVGELHTMAPLYDDLDDAIETLVTEGFIVQTTRNNTPSPKSTTETNATTISKPSVGAATQANHKSIKWKLISLLQVELGTKMDKQIKASCEKMIRDMSGLDEDYETLSKAWKKCVKVTKITIDEELAETIRRRGEELLIEFNN